MTGIRPPRMGPASRWYVSQRLRLHYVDWGNESAPPLLLIHGGRDHCRNWDWVAEALRDDYHVIAPDLRGHGDSQWVIGSGYAMIDYVYDVAQLVHQKRLEPVTIIGHSLGGSISLQYTGIYPETVRKVVSIEGLGPPPRMIEERQSKPAPARMREWIEMVRGMASRHPRRYETLEKALERMQAENPHLSPEQARHLTVHGMNQNEDGTYTWKFDNYVRAFSPYLFNSEEARGLWSNITCPTLLVRGTESWASDPEKDGRASEFQNARVLNVDSAGHWVHHDQLEVFLEAVGRFLEE
ncbi:MAG: alpha/beta fold hydrolase [Myxococcota bacterium]